MEEGCLTLPGVLVDVERPVHVRVRAQDERGEPILVEASGLEARVIQHEIDHLDGVLILDRTPRDERKQAMRRCARPCPPRSATRPEAGGAHRLPGHLRVRRRRARAARRERAPARARRHPARPAARPRARPAAAAGGRARRARSGSSSIAARAAARRRSLERIAAAEPDVLVVCAYGVLVARAAARARTRSSTSTRRCCRAGAARRRSSARSWPATRRPASRSCGSPPGSTPGRCACRSAEPIGPDDDFGTLAARLEARERRAARPRAGRAAAVGGAGRGRRHLRPEDRGGGPRRSTTRARRRRSSAPSGRCGRTSARGCRCPTGACSACVPRAWRGRRSRPPAGASARTASGCCWTAAAARWSCSRSSRRAGRRCPPRPGCAAGPTRASPTSGSTRGSRPAGRGSGGARRARMGLRRRVGAVARRAGLARRRRGPRGAARPSRARPTGAPGPSPPTWPGSSARSSAGGPRRARRCWRRWASARATPRCSR